MATPGTPDAALGNNGFKELPGSSNGDPTGWSAAQKASIDTTGMGIPKMTGYKTGAEIFAAIESMAKTNSDQGKVWGKFRSVVSSGQNYTQKDTNVSWSKKDVNAVKSYLTNVNNYNTTNPSNPVSLAGYVNLDVSSHKSSGLSISSSTNMKTTTPLIPVTSTADLTKIANNSFAATLGRLPSDKEAASFSKQFQDLILSYGNSKVSAKKNAAFEAPAQPIQFQNEGTAASATTVKNPVAATNAIMQPPSPDVAAANFAAKAHPDEASANALAGTVNNILSILKG